MKLLVTGGAGFIGSHACEQLLARGHQVVALDNFDPYYSPAVKRRNVSAALRHPAYKLLEMDYGDAARLKPLFQTAAFDAVLHLAAQAGVRQSLSDPLKYERVNVANLLVLLEAMREYGPRRIVAASSSSVYGNVTPAPFREDAPCLQPLSVYAASKRAAEVFLGTLGTLYGFKVIIVRPFTVYGPRQRPDMAIAHFARKLLRDEPIPLFGDGRTLRDYTYVSDVVSGLVAALEKFPVDFGIYNLGNGTPLSLSALVAALERAVGKKARITRMPPQAGDVDQTCADISKARRELEYAPAVGIDEGLARTVSWVRDGGTA